MVDSKCDLPFRFIEETVKRISEENNDVDLVYLTGDLPPHDLAWADAEDPEKNLDPHMTILRHMPETNLKLMKLKNLMTIFGDSVSDMIKDLFPLYVPSSSGLDTEQSAQLSPRRPFKR